MQYNSFSFLKVLYTFCLILLPALGSSDSVPYCFTGDLHSERLKLLRNKNFKPKVIYDIGANRAHWSLGVQKVFPDAMFCLFEANENYRPELEATPFSIYFALLGDKEQRVVFYSNNTTGDSVFCEQTTYYAEGLCQKKELTMTTLAAFIEKNRIPLPDLIKFDVQGAEKLIIAGSPDVVRHAEVVILEGKILEYNKEAPFLLELMVLMDQLGFRLLDLLECHYLNTGELTELDLLFIKKNSKLIKAPPYL